MIITIDIPDSIHRRLDTEKRKTGISKSLQVRNILEAHYEQLKKVKRVA